MLQRLVSDIERGHFQPVEQLPQQQTNVRLIQPHLAQDAPPLREVRPPLRRRNPQPADPLQLSAQQTQTNQRSNVIRQLA